ncbi:hypothetical protein RSAG8_13448, partial [Rhizoctonia solani AG-8 WAC10335]
MLFNLFVLILWLLALVSPVSDPRQYIQLLSDTMTTMPEKNAHSIVASESVLLVLAAAPVPAPAPRYSPLAVPVYRAGKVKEPKPARFILSKRIISIYRWVNVFYARITDFSGRPRPTKTTYLPTKVFVPVHPALPIPGRHILDDAPVQGPTSSAINLLRLWDTYKLVIGWIAMTCSVVVLAFVRFLFCDRTIPHLAGSVSCQASTDNQDLAQGITSLPEAPLVSSTPIIDIYCSLYSDLPPVTGSNIPRDSDLANHGDPIPKDCKTLEPAVSNDSIGSSSIGLYKEYSFMTPSPSHSPTARSYEELLAGYPTTGQVHTPRSKLWLQGLITRLQEMERRDNYYGRVYDDSPDNPDLEQYIPAPSNRDNAERASSSDTLPTSTSTPFEQDLKMTTGGISSMSTTRR